MDLILRTVTLILGHYRSRPARDQNSPMYRCGPESLHVENTLAEMVISQLQIRHRIYFVDNNERKGGAVYFLIDSVRALYLPRKHALDSQICASDPRRVLGSFNLPMTVRNF